MFEKLDFTFIKLGQALALRFDLLPADYCQELLQITNEVTAEEYSAIHKTIIDDLGRSPDEIFATFERTPFAVTSSGQIHQATSRDGKRLAVKIQDPATRKKYTTDIRLMHWLAAPLDWAGVFGANSVAAYVDEFEHALFSELDLSEAARNATVMSELSKGDAAEFCFAVRKEYTAKRILTWEFVDGIPVRRILNAIQHDDRQYLETLKDQGYDLRLIARRIYWSTLNQIYRDGLFHSDLSPAGILVLPDNRIAYVDFAVVGRFTEEHQDSFRFFMQYTLREQFDDAIDELLRWIEAAPSQDLTGFRRDMSIVLEDYLDGFRSPGGSVTWLAARHVVVRMMSVIRQHGLSIPATVSLYLRALLTRDAIVFELSPKYDPVQDEAQFMVRAARIDVGEIFKQRELIGSVTETFGETREIIANVGKLLTSGRSIEVSLRMLQTRLLQYGIWTALIGTIASLGFREDAFASLNTALGVGPYFIPGTLLFCAFIFMMLALRQGRKLAAIEQSNVIGQEVSQRSLGRVR
ncbi:ABC1 kinase family protein [Bradyrhizobium monzae]|uniref:ABC1 kinase family protein n=1 Tax=Bradyrhizobium sp. Oc8 TaxID=2876780 RepID=UPI001F2F9BA9